MSDVAHHVTTHITNPTGHAENRVTEYDVCAALHEVQGREGAKWGNQLTEWGSSGSHLLVEWSLFILKKNSIKDY